MIMNCFSIDLPICYFIKVCFYEGIAEKIRSWLTFESKKTLYSYTDNSSSLFLKAVNTKKVNYVKIRAMTVVTNHFSLP